MEPRLKVTGHSNTEIVLNNGGVVVNKDLACYSHLWSGWEGMEKLYLWFPKHECPLIAEYVDWVLNSDLFGEAFITKSYEVGIVDGFEVNIHMPTNFLFSAMAALRLPWEMEGYEGWHYQELAKFGFAPKQCLYILTRAYPDKGVFQGGWYNTNHLPIPREVVWENYKPEAFSRQEGTMFQQEYSRGVTKFWASGSQTRVMRLERGDVEITPSLIDTLKEQLKEE